MKSTFSVALALLASVALIACGGHEQAAPKAADVRTVENSPIAAIPIDQQPTISENAPAPQTSTAPGSKALSPTSTSTASSEQELEQKMELPFSPPIAMDPVNGAKVSITTSTPMLEYKKKLYYFTSEDNKRQFAANPESYIHGQLARY